LMRKQGFLPMSWINDMVVVPIWDTPAYQRN